MLRKKRTTGGNFFYISHEKTTLAAIALPI